MAAAIGPVDESLNFTTANKEQLITYCQQNNIPYLTEAGKPPKRDWLRSKVYLHQNGLPTNDHYAVTWLAARVDETNNKLKDELRCLVTPSQQGDVEVLTKHQLITWLCDFVPGHEKSKCDTGKINTSQLDNDDSDAMSGLEEAKGEDNADGGEESLNDGTTNDQRSIIIQLCRDLPDAAVDFFQVLLSSEWMQAYLTQMYLTQALSKTDDQVHDLTVQRDEACTRYRELEASFAKKKTDLNNLVAANKEMMEDYNSKLDENNKLRQELRDLKNMLQSTLSEIRDSQIEQMERWKKMDGYMNSTN